jgi:hypothetical protein
VTFRRHRAGVGWAARRGLQAHRPEPRWAGGGCAMRTPPARRCSCNLFGELLQAVASCSLGQITHALYEVGGQYRRSM